MINEERPHYIQEAIDKVSNFLQHTAMREDIDLKDQLFDKDAAAEITSECLLAYLDGVMHEAEKHGIHMGKYLYLQTLRTEVFEYA